MYRWNSKYSHSRGDGTADTFIHRHQKFRTNFLVTHFVHHGQTKDLIESIFTNDSQHFVRSFFPKLFCPKHLNINAHTQCPASNETNEHSLLYFVIKRQQNEKMPHGSPCGNMYLPMRCLKNSALTSLKIKELQCSKKSSSQLSIKSRNLLACFYDIFTSLLHHITWKIVDYCINIATSF